ncbi:LCP family protein, partial [Fodinicola feengrottensis]
MRGRGTVDGCLLQPDRETNGSGGGTVYTGRTVKPRRNWKRISLIGGGVAVVLILLLGGYAYARVQTLNGNITRTDPFAGLGDRPHKTVDGAQNILVVGDDNADGSRGYQGVEGQRTDAIILLHIPADHTKAYLISIPRDTYVSVPKAKNGLGGNKTKINAAYSYGGAPLLIQTVENFTDVHIDHLVGHWIRRLQNDDRCARWRGRDSGQDGDRPTQQADFHQGRQPPGRHRRTGLRPAAVRAAELGLRPAEAGPDLPQGAAEEGHLDRHADRPRQ